MPPVPTAIAEEMMKNKKFSAQGAPYDTHKQMCLRMHLQREDQVTATKVGNMVQNRSELKSGSLFPDQWAL